MHRTPQSQKGTGPTPSDRQALLGDALKALEEMQAKLEASERSKSEPIAIVGIGCRFPGGADSPDAFWRLLRDGVDAIREVPSDRWNSDAFYDPDPEVPGKAYTRHGGFLDHIDGFDAAFFGITPREAAKMDPQQQLILEVAWEALEHAGLAPTSLAESPTGVFMGIGGSDYSHLQSGMGDLEHIDPYTGSGSGLCFSAGRVSYCLRLQGPSLAVDTACSSSLVAVHLACQSLRAGECSLALAGGVNLMLSPVLFVYLSKLKAISPDGRCRAFDASADGFSRGEGCGIVVLKRLSDALADGDNIVALVRGSAVNQDGPSSGLTVPNGSAQQAVIRQALANAKAAPVEIGYVEAHGTGTPLGDPIEMGALVGNFGPERPKNKPLLVGSVKTNMGHLEAAAGIVGLIKAALALQNEEIPPQLHFKTLNPQILLGGAPIKVVSERVPWPAGAEPRMAGVSSFGLSGTNAHVVLQESPRRGSPSDVCVPGRQERPRHVLAMSAKSPTALEELAVRYSSHLATHPSLSAADVTFTANTGRTHFAHRLALAGESSSALRDQLTAFADGRRPDAAFVRGLADKTSPKVVFLFTGQGAQYANMGRGLYETQPTFRKALERCDELLRAELDTPLLQVIFGGEADSALLDKTAYTQPALFALEYALAQLWRSWGIEPAAVLGHSVGEYVASCVAGVFGLEDALKLIAARARLMGALPREGEMAAVFADEALVRRAIEPYAGAIAVAAFNAPHNIVVSGRRDLVQEALARLEAQGVATHRLNVSHAFHSPMMDPMLGPFEEIAHQVTFRAPRIPLISNVTGEEWGPEAAPDARYWRRHVRQPVRFFESMQTLGRKGYRLFLEVGPHPTLLGIAATCLPGEDHLWLPSLRRGQEDWRPMLESIATLYVQGANVDWARFDRPYIRRKVSLPTYPFQRSRYWMEADGRSRSASPAGGYPAGGHPFLPGWFELADGSGTQVFQGEIGIPLFPYLRDHRVQQGAVVPATAWTEMALGAYTTTHGAGPVIVEGIEYQKPLFLTDDGRYHVQVILTPSSDGVEFSISSQYGDDATGAAGWTRHVTGRMRRGEAADGRRRLDVAEVGARCSDEVAGTDFYPLFRERGNDWGPMFQGVERLWRSPGEAWSVVRVPPALESEVATYVCHPAVADAAGHVLMATVAMERSGGPRGGAFVGGGIEKVRVFRPLRGGRVWSHARLRESEDLAANILVGDVDIFDESGELIAETRGARLWYLDADIPSARRRDVGEWLYGIDWTPSPLPQEAGSARSGPSAGAGRWIVVGTPGPLAELLVKTLASEGESGHLVSSQSDALEARLEEALTTAAQPWRGVVYLAIHDDDLVTSCAKEAGEATGCIQALQVVRVLGAAQGEQVPRLWLVTRGAQAVDNSNVTDALAGAVWGLGRSLAVEHLEIWGGLIDLDPSANDEESAVRIVAELSVPSGDDQIAFRGETRLVPRLARLRPRPAPPLPLRVDASYLVTGGFGGLGLAVARALVQRGARHVVLMARTELPARVSWRDLPDGPGVRAEAVWEIERLGASVLPAAVDIADPDALSAWLDGFRAEGRPPIRGVMHLAGVLAHRALHEETAEGLEAALRPKVLGALSLHRLLRGEELDFFVLFSSAAAVLNSPLLGAYAAANAFLDALAHYRRGRGLTALSVNWGLWGEAGMAKRFDAEGVAALAQRGMGTIGTAEGLEALWRLVAAEVAQAAVLPVDWAEWARRYPAFAEAPFLSKVVAGTALRDERGAIADEKRSATREAILAASAEERTHLVEVFVTEEVAQAMRVAPGELDVRQPLRTLGLDSLMAVEIKNRTDAALGVSLPLRGLLGGASVSELVAEVLSGLADAESSPATGAAGRPESSGRYQTLEGIGREEAERLLENLDKLSDEEVDALLRMLSGPGELKS